MSYSPTKSSSSVIPTASSGVVAVGDHIKWQSAFTVGTNIVADTTTPYTTLPGPSLGRFTLQPGYVYRLDACVQVGFSSAIAAINYLWTSDSGADLGILFPGAVQTTGLALPTTFAIFNISTQMHAVCVFKPTAVVIVETRISVNTAVLNYSNTSSFAFIQEL